MSCRRFLSATTVALGLALPATPIYAESAEFTFDKPHTIIYFTVNRAGFSNMLGRFQDFSGSLTIDPDKPETAQVSSTIKTASIFTGFEARDKHLRSPDFFNAQEFPEMTFTSTKVERTGDKTAKVTGDLTLLGVSKPVTFDVTFNKMAVNPRSQKEQIGFSGVGTLKRSEFGMKFALGPIVDDVTMHLEILANKK